MWGSSDGCPSWVSVAEGYELQSWKWGWNNGADYLQRSGEEVESGSRALRVYLNELMCAMSLTTPADLSDSAEDSAEEVGMERGGHTVCQDA